MGLYVQLEFAKFSQVEIVDFPKVVEGRLYKLQTNFTQNEIFVSLFGWVHDQLNSLRIYQ